MLAALKRETEALSSWEEAIRGFEAGGLPEVAEPFCNALMNRAAALHHAGRFEEALQLWGDVVKRFGADDRPRLLAMVANAQTNRGALLEQSGRYEDALAVWQQVEDRFGTNDRPEVGRVGRKRLSAQVRRPVRLGPAGRGARDLRPGNRPVRAKLRTGGSCDSRRNSSAEGNRAHHCTQERGGAGRLGRDRTAFRRPRRAGNFEARLPRPSSARARRSPV